jgi:uncharacterized glyoxalase superfamily protein PhnB
LNNRSVPENRILPHVFYEDVAAASAWLCKNFGFVEYYSFKLPDGQLHGALIKLGEVWVMLKSKGKFASSPSKLGGFTQSLMIFIEDIETHYHTARLAMVNIVEELNYTEYGEQHYVANDPEGHEWIFARHVRDIHPEEWGATLSGLRGDILQ